MPTSAAALDTTQYVQINSHETASLLQCTRDTVRLVFNDAKPALGNSVFHLLKPEHPPLRIDNVDTNIWALAMTDTSGLIITEFPGDPLTRDSVLDDGNSGRLPDITAPTAAAPFEGSWELATGFNTIKVSLTCDSPGRLCVLLYDQYDTPTAASTPTDVVEYVYDGGSENETYNVNTCGRWYRVVFEPSYTVTSFQITTYKLKSTPGEEQSGLVSDETQSYYNTAEQQRDDIMRHLRAVVWALCQIKDIDYDHLIDNIP